MSLREQFDEDLDIFFDLDEMATEHDLQGRKLQLVVDSDQLQKNALQDPGGIFDGDFLLFAKTRDLSGLRIAAGSLIELDARPYQILSVIDEDGVTQITLSAAQGGH